MDAARQGTAWDRVTTWKLYHIDNIERIGTEVLPAWGSFALSHTRLRNDSLALSGRMLKYCFWPGSVVEASWFCVVAAEAAAAASRSVEKQKTLTIQWDSGWGRPTFYPSTLARMLTDANTTPHHSAVSWTVSRSPLRRTKEAISYQWPLRPHLKPKQNLHHRKTREVPVIMLHSDISTGPSTDLVNL